LGEAVSEVDIIKSNFLYIVLNMVFSLYPVDRSDLCMSTQAKHLSSVVVSCLTGVSTSMRLWLIVSCIRMILFGTWRNIAILKVGTADFIINWI